MTEVIYDVEFNTQNSSVIKQAFYDENENVLYLVFNNLTTVSRRLPPHYNARVLGSVDSWGQFWNYTARLLPAGPDVENGSEFVHRALASAPAVETTETEVRVTADMVSRFQRAFEDAEDNFEDYDTSVCKGLEAAFEAVPSVDAGPVAGRGFADAAEEGGTFIGIGFVNVPEEHLNTLTGLVNNFDEFVAENVGRVTSVIERFDIDQLRRTLGRLL